MVTLARRATFPSFREIVSTASLDALVCIWLFSSAFVFTVNHAFFVNNLAAGGIAAILAFFGPFANRRFAWLPTAIGVWVAASPIALGFMHEPAAALNNVLTGIAIVVLSLRSRRLSEDAHDAGVLPE